MNATRKKGDPDKHTRRYQALQALRPKDFHPLFLQAGPKATLTQCLDTISYMIKNDEARPIADRVDKLHTPLSFIAASPIEFGSKPKKEAAKISGKPVDKLKAFRNFEVPRIAVGVMMENGAVEMYREKLFEEVPCISRVRNGIGAILTRYAKTTRIPLTPGGKKKNITHYFFPDGIDCSEEPRNEDTEFTSDERAAVPAAVVEADGDDEGRQKKKKPLKL